MVKCKIEILCAPVSRIENQVKKNLLKKYNLYFRFYLKIKIYA